MTFDERRSQIQRLCGELLERVNKRAWLNALSCCNDLLAMMLMGLNDELKGRYEARAE